MVYLQTLERARLDRPQIRREARAADSDRPRADLVEFELPSPDPRVDRPSRGEAEQGHGFRDRVLPGWVDCIHAEILPTLGERQSSAVGNYDRQ